jgi:GcrA cell cycle regulator
MPNQRSGMWDKALEDKACRMWNDEGLSASRIARMLTVETGRNYTKNSIIGKMHRLQKAGRAESRKSPIKKAKKECLKECFKPVSRRDIKTLSEKRDCPRLSPIVHNFKPIPRPVVVCDEPRPDGSVTILELRRHHCRWPMGEPSFEMRYCGAQAMEDRPYCAAHHRIAYRPRENKTPSRRLD